MKFDERKEVIGVVSMNELKALGKAIMTASVDAEFLGLETVTQYLSLAFDEMARHAVELRKAEAEAKARRFLSNSGGNGSGD